ncbi:MAG: SgcJ/EcaC family oxidoreductase [Candidatus Eremiobacteraeota bacterium]|nr:SgcJ/EcaC family oxidoreductase [Candidatus Eremiobacteraeota bacterium]
MRDIEELVSAMESAWNNGDSAAFAAAFAEDADFVNVYGLHARGRDAIAAGHQFIFMTVYKGSQVEYRIDSMRELVPGVTLVHVSAKLNVPEGPMAGKHAALWSGVAMSTSDGWKFAAFQNTFVKPPPNQYGR